MKDSDWSTYRRLLSYVRPYWPAFVLAIFGFFLGSGAEAYFVSLFGKLIDQWDSAGTGQLLYIPIFMFAAAVVRGAGEIIGELLLSRISFSVVHKLRSQLFDRLLNLRSSFFDASSQGHIVSRITFNVAQLRDTGTDALKSLISDGGKVIVYLGYMFFLSWKLTLIFIASAPLVALVVMFASKRFRRISRRIQNSMGDVTHVASEMVSGYRVVRLFGGETYERERFDLANENNRQQNLKMVATKVSSTQIIQIMVAGALAFLIAVLFQPELGSHLSTGEVVTFLGLAGMLARPIRKLSEINARLQRGLAAAEDVFAQLDEPSEADEGTKELERAQGRIEFCNVSFSYDSRSSEVLKGINLTVEPGQTVAVVGRSGSGKSTLASLIPRFYETTSGEILLDGVAISDYRLADLREQIALVNQRVILFNDTLAQNIAYGSLAGADAAAIQSVVERAHADGFIKNLPEGLQTLVGDDGVLLSGGQRQRIAIARALLKDAPILILDEATSALDAESERHIQSALDEAMRGRTTIVIAHRLSTIEKADRIVVMDEGRIVETGDHESLLAAKGPYHQLYNAQFEDDSKSTSKPRQTTGPSLPKGGHRNRSAAGSDGFWYRESRRSKLLAPAAWAFSKVAGRRRAAFVSGAREVWKAPVPVIVVGNITVGGTGKTPFVIWLVRWLRQQGLQPGIVSRGYGGSAKQVTRVAPNADPTVVGDEPPLLARRTGAPVVIGKDRVAAVQHLLERWSVDVVIADDGLQHYALGRDVEIVLIDGTRGLGNGLQLPAGPLREPAERLQEVDWVVANGASTGLVNDEAVMHVVPQAFVKVSNSRVRLSVPDFIAAHRDVHAIAAIGNPERFAQTLRNIGLVPLLRSYPDHHMFDGSELARTDSHVFVCTEKDAVKLATLVDVPADLWYLEIDVNFNDVAQQQLRNLMVSKGLLEDPIGTTTAPVMQATDELVATAKDVESGES